MAAKMTVLGLILSSYPYLRSAMVRFPFITSNSKHPTFACPSRFTWWNVPWYNQLEMYNSRHWNFYYEIHWLFISFNIKRPGRSQGLLYKPLCHSFVWWLSLSHYSSTGRLTPWHRTPQWPISGDRFFFSVWSSFRKFLSIWLSWSPATQSNIFIYVRLFIQYFQYG